MLLKSRFRLAAVTVLALLATLLFASPANANTYHPYGCDPNFRTIWWNAPNTCWQGSYFIDHGTSVLGVQFILFFHSTASPGTPDCEFGPKTDNSTVKFQQANGLTADGIAGPATRQRLRTKLAMSPVEDTYGIYYNNGPDGLRFYENFFAGANPIWHVLTPWHPSGGTYAAMNDGALVGTFCPY